MRGKGNVLKHTASSVNRGRGNSVMTWVCMAVNGAESLLFFDHVAAGRSSTMNSEVYRTIVFITQIQSNAAKPIRMKFTVLMDTDSVLTAKATQKQYKWNVL